MNVKLLFIIRMIVNLLALVFFVIYALFGGVWYLVIGYSLLAATIVMLILFWIARKKEEKKSKE